jgi:hypothetical protein
MSRQVKRAVVHTVSLVGKPANQRKFLMLKSEDHAYEMFRKLMDELGDRFNPGLLGLVAMEDQKNQEAEKPAEQKQLELPQEVQAQLVEFEKSQKEAQQKIIELQKSLDEQKTLREVQEEIAKCEKSFKNIPMAAQELGALFVTLRKSAGGETSKKVEELLTGIEALLEKTMAPIGSDNAAPTQNQGAWERIEKKAKELQANGQAKTYSDGVAKALSLDPELYRAYLAEQKGQ